MSTQMTNSIADAIGALPSPFPPVILSKHYKGITMSQQGHIVSINPSFATVRATQRMTFHILLGMIHLRSEAFPGAISATILPIDFSQGTFHLSDLSYGEWRNRKAERVQPKSPTYVDMSLYRKTYRGFLEDISYEGVGILVNRTSDPNDRLQPGVKLMLRVQLAAVRSLVQLKGSIVYRKNFGQQLIKLGLHLFPNAGQKTNLKDYIINRHDEILCELEQDYTRTHEPCRVENLYF